MVRAGPAPAETTPFRIEPQRGEVSKNNGKAALCEGSDVFDEDEVRPERLDDTRELAPETGACAIEAAAPAIGSRVADVLAGEATTDDVWSFCSLIDFPHVVVALDPGPVRLEDGAGVRVAVALPEHRAEAARL